MGDLFGQIVKNHILHIDEQITQWIDTGTSGSPLSIEISHGI